MEWYDLLSDGYGRVLEFLNRVLEGLTEDDLNWQPRDDGNSIGWLAWHLTRQEDSQIASLMGEGQLWLTEKWHDRFNRPADPKDIGFGHTPEQVASFRSPDTATLLDTRRQYWNVPGVTSSACRKPTLTASSTNPGSSRCRPSGSASSAL